MKTNQTNPEQKHATATASFKSVCVACYQKALAGVARVKAAILAEARPTTVAPEQMMRLALNEAEALAWQTNYPHLVFPTLAAEKIQAVAHWAARQQSVRTANPVLALAA